MSVEPQVVLDAERRKRIRRTTLLFSLIAAAFYFGFIIMAVVKASS
ncbi:MAG TPA: hypothetical protein VGM84_04425 [Steroidobacteraceae bacterium]|jgi:hypothetical protein